MFCCIMLVCIFLLLENLAMCIGFWYFDLCEYVMKNGYEFWCVVLIFFCVYCDVGKLL